MTQAQIDAAQSYAAPRLTSREVTLVVDRLRRAQARLGRRSSQSILAALDAVVDLWLDPASSWREEARSLLPAASGFSVPMIEHALPSMIEPLRAPALRKLLIEEVESAGRAGAIDTPRLVVHLLSGNITGLAAIPIALALALRAAIVIKAAAGDRIFPELFARSIEVIDRELGAAVAVVYWPGGDRACEEAAFRHADLVVAYGSDETITRLGARCPKRFIGHGQRISFAVVTAEVAAVETGAEAAALALDTSVWDQRGCLSPQICFVEGDFAAALRFAERVAAALDVLARELPTGRRTLEEQAALRRFRNEAEWQCIAGERVKLLVPADSLAWTVVVEAAASFRPTPLDRSLRICPIPSLDSLPSLLGPHRAFLEGAGLAADESRRPPIVRLLRQLGVHYICPLGSMQSPPLSWSQGGHPRLGSWIERRGKA